MKVHTATHGSGQSHYGRLLVMIGLSFLAMYVLMYAMVNSFENVYMNIKQVYMADLMAAPMGVIELALMSAMYRDKRPNAVVIAGSILALAVFWTLIRQQAMVSDRQFLRSMIPRHAGAILMCEEAPIARGQHQSVVQGHRRRPTRRDRSDESNAARIGRVRGLACGGL